MIGLKSVKNYEILGLQVGDELLLERTTTGSILVRCWVTTSLKNDAVLPRKTTASVISENGQK